MRTLSTVFATCFFFAVAICQAAASTAAERPSVLLIYADDQRADTIGAYGNPHIRTPNLDRLTEEGQSFRRTYCMGSNNGAVCVPSRAMLLTGRSLFHVSEKLDQGEPLMPRVFSDAGYRTFFTGKWHNGYGKDAENALSRAFDTGDAIYLGGMGDHLALPLVTLRNGRAENRRVAGRYSTELFTEAATGFLERSRGSSDPFFLYVAMTAPHDPRQPPQGYGERFADSPPPLPPNFLPQHPFDNGSLVLRDENLAAWPRDPAVIREQLGQYYAMIEHLDAHVGRLVESARRADPNVIVVYAADHGLALGSHGLLGKQSVYEHSMRAPLIFAGPGIEAGENERLTYLFDIFPTLAELCGVPLPPGVDGVSQALVLAGEDAPARDALYLSYKGQQKAAVTDEWKLIRYPEVGVEQLFHLAKDPHEVHDLIDVPEHAAKRDELQSLLRSLHAAADDRFALAVDSLKPRERDLTGTPRKADRWQPDWIVERYFEADEQ